MTMFYTLKCIDMDRFYGPHGKVIRAYFDRMSGGFESGSFVPFGVDDPIILADIARGEEYAGWREANAFLKAHGCQPGETIHVRML